MASNHYYPDDQRDLQSKPTVRRPSTQIDTAALLNALPADKADRLRLRVDKNSDGGIDVDELGELFAELEKDERKISHLRWFLALAVTFLAISIGANFGTSMYAAEKARSTGSKSEEVPSIVTTEPAKLLTDTEGNVLRTDRSLDEAPMSSQLPDTAFDELEYLRIVGPEGKINFKVHGWARYDEEDSRCGSVVVLYTIAGHVQFDGVSMSFDEATSGAFSRAGFDVVRRHRRGRRTPSGNDHTLTGIQEVIGLFKFVSQLDTSSLKCGDDIPSIANNPFANATEVLYTEHLMYSCETDDVEADRQLCPANVKTIMILGDTYYKRVRTTHAKKIDGQWFSVSKLEVPEAPSELSYLEMSDGMNLTAMFTFDAEASTDKCFHITAMDQPRTKGFSDRVPENPEQFKMRFVGYDVINDVYVRHYKLYMPEDFSDKLAASAEGDGSAEVLEDGKSEHAISLFEHYDEDRLYGLFIFQPDHLGLFEEIIVNPSPSQIEAASFGVDYSFPSDKDDADDFFQPANDCLSKDDSFARNLTDLSLYKTTYPYTKQRSEVAIEDWRFEAEKAERKAAEEIEQMEAWSNSTERKRRSLPASCTISNPLKRSSRNGACLIKHPTIPGIPDRDPLTPFSGGNDNYARNLEECTGECDQDSQCKSGLKCKQRDHGELVPGCDGFSPGDSWDYCYDPDKDERVTLQGGNNNNAHRSLDACIGDCDDDSQCKTGLKCFQRSTSVSNVYIPGCKGGGIHGWDYCFDPDKTQGAFDISLSHFLKYPGEHHVLKLVGGAETCLPGVCSNPKIVMYGAITLELSTEPGASYAALEAGIHAYGTILDYTIHIQLSIEGKVESTGKLVITGKLKVGFSPLSITPRLVGTWNPPLLSATKRFPRKPDVITAGIEACLGFCADFEISVGTGPL